MMKLLRLRMAQTQLVHSQKLEAYCQTQQGHSQTQQGHSQTMQGHFQTTLLNKIDNGCCIPITADPECNVLIRPFQLPYNIWGYSDCMLA